MSESRFLYPIPENMCEVVQQHKNSIFYWAVNIGFVAVPFILLGKNIMQKSLQKIKKFKKYKAEIAAKELENQEIVEKLEQIKEDLQARNAQMHLEIEALRTKIVASDTKVDVTSNLPTSAKILAAIGYKLSEIEENTSLVCLAGTVAEIEESYIPYVEACEVEDHERREIMASRLTIGMA